LLRRLPLNILLLQAVVVVVMILQAVVVLAVTEQQPGYQLLSVALTQSQLALAGLRVLERQLTALEAMVLHLFSHLSLQLVVAVGVVAVLRVYTLDALAVLAAVLGVT